MTQVTFSLEHELKIPAFSKESLLSLITQNIDILEKELDESAEISIQIEANLDWDVAIDNSTDFKVPAYYLPIERYELNEQASKIFEQALNIQREASGVIKEHQHHYGHSIFRKLATAIKKLEILRALPELENINPIDSRDLFITRNFINRLLGDGKKKLSQTEIRWEYKEWGNLSSDFKRYDSRRLLDLVGGKELFEQAIEQSAEFDITKYITEYNKKLQQEQVIKPFNISKSNNTKKIIALSLSSIGSYGMPASYSIATELLSDYSGGKNDNIICLYNMEEVIWKLQELQENGNIKKVRYVLINSAPPYYGRPNLEQFELMMKYGIYNRGFGNCDYDGGCVDDIKGIINLLKGEFPELPRPIIICDTKSAWDSYSGIDCIPIALDDHKSFYNRLQLIKKELIENTSK